MKTKNLNEELDNLLLNTNLPSDKQIENETRNFKNSQAGKKGGNSNKLSGHMKKIQKENAHIGGKIMGPINGKLYGKYNLAKISREDRVKGGKIGGAKRVLMDDWKDLQKKAGKISGDKRIKEKLNKFKSIIKLIKKSEFTLMDVKKACIKFGLKESVINCTAKKIVKEKNLIKQIHKGYNQFNPSIYIKINLEI